MKIVPIKNELIIKAALNVEDAYELISYDGSPSLIEFDTSKYIWFILVKDGWTAGIVALQPFNNVLWSPHIIIYKKYRGKGSEEWGKQIVNFMTQNFGAKKFLAFTPYVAAKKYAEKVGFKCVGTLSKSILKNGELLDQFTLEL